MRGRLLVPVLAAAVASVGALSSCTTAAAAPAASIDLAVAASQQVALDPTSAGVDISYSVTACPNGCALVRVRTLRANVEEKQVDLRTFAEAGRRVFRVRDAVTAQPAFGWSTAYEVRVFRTNAHTTYTRAAAVQATPVFTGEDAFRYDSRWRRELNSGVTETLIQRSWTTGATATLPAGIQGRKVGLVAAKGPNNGVVRIAVNGRTTQTLDLRATTWQARQVVVAVDLPAKAVLTVQNATPAGRTSRDVHVDGLITLPVQSLATGTEVRTTRGDTQPVAAGPEPAVESVDARVRPGQQLPRTGSGPELEVTARAFGCPSGCTLVRRTYDMNGASDVVLLDRTSPASGSLQTLTATDRQPFSSDAVYVLKKGGTDVATSSGFNPTLVPSSRTATSYGWVKENNAGHLGGSAWRSSTPDTGVTYRANGAFEGRNVAVVAAKGPRGGVLAVYADGKLLQAIDLYSATAQPRQVVASVDLSSSGRLTVANRTPATRANKDVVLDDLVLLERPDDYY